MIKSPSPNSAITNVSVNLLGFSSSPDKKSLLSFALDNLNIGENLSLSGKITNNGKLNSTNTKIYLISYDPFTPPRVLGIATTEIDDVIKVGDSHDFNFNVPRDARATIFKIVAESKDYSSGLVDVTKTTVDFISSLVTINDISVTDSEGNRLPDLMVNSPVNIQSELTIQYSPNQKPEVQPYVYYIQIKQSGEKAFVEYIGKVEGSFNSNGQQLTTVPWTPQQDGLYFIETVALGGTFDIIHKGHMTLLTKAFSISSHVIIGLAGDELVAKKGKNIINNYSKRLESLTSTIQQYFPNSSYAISKLENDFGPAAIEGKVDALVVSEETSNKGDILNKLRQKRNLPLVDVVIVPMVLAEDGSRISTTRIKKSEIDPEGNLS